MKVDLGVLPCRFWKYLRSQGGDDGSNCKFPPCFLRAKGTREFPIAPQASSRPVRDGDGEIQFAGKAVDCMVKAYGVLHHISPDSLSL